MSEPEFNSLVYLSYLMMTEAIELRIKLPESVEVRRSGFCSLLRQRLVWGVLIVMVF
jgi:hypothetical protein